MDGQEDTENPGFFVSSRLQRVSRMYREYFANWSYVQAFFLSLSFLAVSVIATFYAGIYATERASNYVTDIILSNIPVWNVDLFFVYGTFFAIALVAFLVALKLKWIPFVASSLGLFYCVRSAFITLTHIGPFPERATFDVGYVIGTFLAGNDLFFSGHTGAPFLLALIFWNFKHLRYLFLALSVFFAAIVLLGHLHYTIDVAAAYFITYSIFHAAKMLFRKHHRLFHEGLPAI